MRQMRRNHCQLYKNFEVALAESKLPTFGTVTDWFYHAALNREICSLIANLSRDNASFFPCSPVLQPIKEASASLDDELDKYFGKAQSVSRCDDRSGTWTYDMMDLWTRLQFDGLVFPCVVQEAPAPCVESMKPEEMQELWCRGPIESYRVVLSSMKEWRVPCFWRTSNKCFSMFSLGIWRQS